MSYGRSMIFVLGEYLSAPYPPLKQINNNRCKPADSNRILIQYVVRTRRISRLALCDRESVPSDAYLTINRRYLKTSIRERRTTINRLRTARRMSFRGHYSVVFVPRDGAETDRRRTLPVHRVKGSRAHVIVL